MGNLFSWLFFLIIFLIIFLTTKSKRNLNFILLTSFLIRFFFVLLEQFNLINLPDSTADALYFDSYAVEFSRNQGLTILFDFYKKDSLLISRILSVFYTLFGENIMIAKGISVALGTASVYLVYKICLVLWDKRSAEKAAWVAAIFPSLVLYSCLTLREVYINFFLLYGILAIIDFWKKKNIFLFIKVLIIFYILILFHGALFVGLLAFIFFYMISLIKKIFIQLCHLKLDIYSFLFLFILLIPIILFFTESIKIPNFDSQLYKFNVGIRGNAQYPEFLLINNYSEFFIKTLFKIFYFLYSPFVWDIKSSYHSLAYFDGILYFILTIYLIKNWIVIKKSPLLMAIFLMLISFIVIYALGVGNFGTAFRHRSKFLVILIILAAPKINKFTFIIKKRYKN